MCTLCSGRNFRKSLSLVQTVALYLFAEDAISASSRSVLLGLKFAAFSASVFVNGATSIWTLLRKVTYLSGGMPAVR